MPRMDGLTFLERLRASSRTRDIPVVILSNYNEPELVAGGLRLGALEYLIKTQITPRRLSEGVRSWSRPYEFSGGQDERCHT
jgi:CheY-like chemotaxis protein